MSDARAKQEEFEAASNTIDGRGYSDSGVETMLASQRRNIEAMMEASRLALDGVQAVWRRQLEFMQEAAEGFTTLMGHTARPNGSLKEHFAKHAEFSRLALENNLWNAQGLSELVTKVTNDTMSVINRRIVESLNETLAALEKPKRQP